MKQQYYLSWAVITRMLAEGKSLSGRERNCCFLNFGQLPFADISAAAGFDFLDDARAVALVDWDFDGDLDIWTYNRTGPRIRLLCNGAPPQGNHSVLLRLEGRTCNRDAIGARVELHLEGVESRRLIRTLRAGDGFLSQSSKWIHFGLGAASSIDRLVVRWPGGEQEQFTGAEIDGRYTLVEGSGTAVAWDPPADRMPLEPSEREPKIPPVTDRARVVLAARLPLPALEYMDLEGQRVSLDEQLQGPTLVNVWATWCKPCLAELSSFAQHREQLESSQLNVIALNVDEPADEGEAGQRRKAKQYLGQLDFPFRAGVLTPNMAFQLDSLQRGIVQKQRPLALPISFLVDADGQVAVVYKGPVDVEVLLADIKLLPVSLNRHRELAVPFPGRWYTDPPAGNPLRTAMKLFDAGQLDMAVAYLQKFIRVRKQLQDSDKTADADLLRRGLPDIYYALARIQRQQGDDDQAIAACHKAIQLDSNLRKAQLELGSILLDQRNMEEAAHHLQAALILKRDDPDTLCLLAMTRLGQRRFDDVIRLCTVALKLDANHTTAHYNLAFALEQKGEMRLAVKHYCRVLELQPTFAMAANNLAWILATSNEATIRNGVLAIQLVQRINRIESSMQSIVLRTLASAYAEVGQFDEAIRTAEKAIDLATANGQLILARQVQADVNGYRAGQPLRTRTDDL